MINFSPDFYLCPRYKSKLDSAKAFSSSTPLFHGWLLSSVFLFIGVTCSPSLQMLFPPDPISLWVLSLLYCSCKYRLGCVLVSLHLLHEWSSLYQSNLDLPRLERPIFYLKPEEFYFLKTYH